MAKEYSHAVTYLAATPVRAAHQLITEIGCIEKQPTIAAALLTHSRHLDHSTE